METERIPQADAAMALRHPSPRTEIRQSLVWNYRVCVPSVEAIAREASGIDLESMPSHDTGTAKSVQPVS